MNEDFNVFEEEVLTRIDVLEEEINKLRRFLECVRKGLPFEESWNEEIFYEVNSEYSSLESHMTIMLEHLLKLTFCTNNRSHNQWIRQILNHRNKIIIITGWGLKKQSTNKITFLNENIGDMYKSAVGLYISDSKTYSDLQDGINKIPDDCPWTIEQLLGAGVSDLVEILKK